ncbi:MAG TPA: hypothetical protein VJW73_13595 [Gemmatimonadaceae bacterium]|nr:hypothetical protein [Gemmatimonadaceae bacterium]
MARPTVSAQAAERPMTAADLPSRLAPTTRQAIVHLGDSLRAAGLPDAPLYAKAAEGVLKGAADARILVVLRTLARELGDARASLGSGADEAELVAGASALHVGASPAMLRQLHDTHAGASRAATSLATPLVAFADLLARRVPAAVAAAAIDSLVARGAPGDDFAALRAGVGRDIDAGRAPEASVVQRMQGLLRNIEGRRRTP